MGYSVRRFLAQRRTGNVIVGNINGCAIAALFASPIALGGRSILLTPAFGMAERGALAPSSLIAAATLSAASAAERGKRWLIHSSCSSGDAPSGHPGGAAWRSCYGWPGPVVCRWLRGSTAPAWRAALACCRCATWRWRRARPSLACRR